MPSLFHFTASVPQILTSRVRLFGMHMCIMHVFLEGEGMEGVHMNGPSIGAVECIFYA